MYFRLLIHLYILDQSHTHTDIIMKKVLVADVCVYQLVHKLINLLVILPGSLPACGIKHSS